MIRESWGHTLSFAIRFNNHFTGRPVADELPVRLDTTFIRPVLAPRSGHRQDDGTYRFIDVASGTHRVRWLPPFSDSYRGWVSWEADPMVQVPLSNPAELIVRDLWPAANADVPPGVTAVRGRLVGDNVSDLRVRITNPTFPTPSFTYSNTAGDFLFLLPEPVATDSNGRIELDIEVANGTRVVDGGEFMPAASGAVFPAAAGDPPDRFTVAPGRSSRVLFRIT